MRYDGDYVIFVHQTLTGVPERSRLVGEKIEFGKNYMTDLTNFFKRIVTVQDLLLVNKWFHAMFKQSFAEELVNIHWTNVSMTDRKKFFLGLQQKRGVEGASIFRSNVIDHSEVIRRVQNALRNATYKVEMIGLQTSEFDFDVVVEGKAKLHLVGLSSSEEIVVAIVSEIARQDNARYDMLLTDHAFLEEFGVTVGDARVRFNHMFPGAETVVEHDGMAKVGVTTVAGQQFRGRRARNQIIAKADSEMKCMSEFSFPEYPTPKCVIKTGVNPRNAEMYKDKDLVDRYVLEKGDDRVVDLISILAHVKSRKIVAPGDGRGSVWHACKYLGLECFSSDQNSSIFGNPEVVECDYRAAIVNAPKNSVVVLSHVMDFCPDAVVLALGLNLSVILYDKKQIFKGLSDLIQMDGSAQVWASRDMMNSVGQLTMAYPIGLFDNYANKALQYLKIGIVSENIMSFLRYHHRLGTVFKIADAGIGDAMLNEISRMFDYSIVSRADIDIVVSQSDVNDRYHLDLRTGYVGYTQVPIDIKEDTSYVIRMLSTNILRIFSPEVVGTGMKIERLGNCSFATADHRWVGPRRLAIHWPGGGNSYVACSVK